MVLVVLFYWVGCFSILVDLLGKLLCGVML